MGCPQVDEESILHQGAPPSPRYYREALPWLTLWCGEVGKILPLCKEDLLMLSTAKS